MIFQRSFCKVLASSRHTIRLFFFSNVLAPMKHLFQWHQHAEIVPFLFALLKTLQYMTATNTARPRAITSGPYCELRLVLPSPTSLEMPPATPVTPCYRHQQRGSLFQSLYWSQCRGSYLAARVRASMGPSLGSSGGIGNLWRGIRLDLYRSAC
jgi:hypothetical protein